MQRLKNIGFCRVFTRCFLVILSLFCINWRVLHVDKTLPLRARARARALQQCLLSHASLSLILSPWRHRRCAKPVNIQLCLTEKTVEKRGEDLLKSGGSGPLVKSQLLGSSICFTNSSAFSRLIWNSKMMEPAKTSHQRQKLAEEELSWPMAGKHGCALRKPLPNVEFSQLCC